MYSSCFVVDYMNMASKKKNMYYKHLNRRRVRSEMQIKSEVKGTQVAASTQKNHSMLARLQEPEAGAHMWEKNSSTGLTWLNYHPNFMNILKCVARTTNIVDRFKCVGVCVSMYQHLGKYHHFQQCGWALLFYCFLPNSDKTFISFKITTQIFPTFLPSASCDAHLFIFFCVVLFFSLFSCK